MAKYIILTRIEPAQVADKGADTGDIISIRPENSIVTEKEKQLTAQYIAELTDQELKQLRKDIHPEHSLEADITILNPNSTFDERMLMLRDSLKTNPKPKYGCKIDIDNVLLGLTQKQKDDLKDLKKKTIPITLTNKALIARKF